MSGVNKSYEIYVSIAGISTRIITTDRNLARDLQVSLDNFTTDGNSSNSFALLLESRDDYSTNFKDVTKCHYHVLEDKFFFDSKNYSGFFSFDLREGSVIISRDIIIPEIEYILRLLYSFLGFLVGGLLVHASGIIVNHLGFIFVGKSGAGKSTIARNANGNTILGDDLLLVYPGNNGWDVFSTPFTNPDVRNIHNCMSILRKIYFLEKDIINFTEHIPISDAVAELVSNVPIVPSLPTYSLDVLERCHQVLTQVAYSRLHFRPDMSYLSVINKE